MMMKCAYEMMKPLKARRSTNAQLPLVFFHHALHRRNAAPAKQRPTVAVPARERADGNKDD